MPQLAVRPYNNTDIDFVVNYLYRLSSNDANRMGIDTKRLPSEEQFASSMLGNLELQDENRKFETIIWLVNQQPIGFASLKDFLWGQTGSLHLHMWNASLRGKGYGARLFCLSVLHSYQRFALKKLICEPKAENSMPNKMLQKIGFRLSGKRQGRSSDISRLTLLNCYEIDAETASIYLSQFSD